MTREDLVGDVVLTGPQIGEFCDLVATLGPQAFQVDRLRKAERITRAVSLGQTEFRVLLDGKRGQVVLPVKGL